MKFTDIFVRRPVLATVISLAILVLGLRAAGSLPVQQYPSTENAVVTVTTAYFGADPETISGFITTPLETAIAQVNGIDYMTSSSSSGLSTITINLRLNWDADKALTEIDTKVNSVRNQLPPDAQQPVLNVAVGQTILIVEDNELNMTLFHDLIQAQGYKILQTKDGMDALKLARQHKPDLILMDIQLPEVSGLEVTKWIKEDDNLRSIPIIAVTAFAMKGDEEKIREGGCEAYIAKPISVVQFLETVDRFLQ